MVFEERCLVTVSGDLDTQNELNLRNGKSHLDSLGFNRFEE
jgi:hypothetical protein